MTPAIGLPLLVYDDERKAKPVSDRVPGIVVTEVENFFAHGIEQAQTFARVVEIAGVLAGDRKAAAITGCECSEIFDDQNGLARVKVSDGTAGETEHNAVGETDTVEVEGNGPDIFEFEIFEILRAVRAADERCGMVHDLGNAEILLWQAGRAGIGE